MFKRLATLLVLGVAILSAKTYTFSISDEAQAGQVQLKPGAYHVKIEGSQVVLSDSSGQKIDANAKLETTGEKFDQTAVETTKVGGANRIQWVELGGTRDKVVFQ